MSLSILSRPRGRILTDQLIFVETFQNDPTGSNVVGFRTNIHGFAFAGNDIVYIECAVSEYSGFFIVFAGDADEFYLLPIGMPSLASNLVKFTKNVTSATIYKTTAHPWNAVHLPMIYNLQSTKWPINTVDTARTVTSYTDDNGYVKLNCSGVLNANISELEFVKVTFTGGESVVYQVIGFYSTSSVTINLPYVAGLTFVSVQYYYNNYHARIRIYAGLVSSHKFASQKPYTLVTEQRIIPDERGLIVFNINEFLKDQIEIFKNDTLAGTLPNNIDSFCQFYITYAEGYDYTEGGYTLMDFVSSYTDDSAGFQGYAVNSDLPFKNMHSGYLSDYVYGWQNTAKFKFLTPSIYPEITPNQFFDISFVNQFGNGLRMKRENYQNGSIVNLSFDTIDVFDIGIYRYPVEQSIYLEDRIDLTLQYEDYTGWVNVSETKTITVNECCSANEINLTWLNYLGGFDYWVFKSDSDLGIEIESTKTVKKNIFTNWPKSYGKGADTINQQTQRISRQVMTIRAENLTEEQISDLYRIRLSPLVQIIVSAEDRRTVIVDGSSFTYLQQRGKLFNLQFNISFTDNHPSQSL